MATRKKSLAEGPAPEELAEPTGDWIETLLADAIDIEGRWQAVNEATAARIGTFHKALLKASRAPMAQRDQRARDLAQAALKDRDLADLWPPIRRALHLAGPAPEPAPAPPPKNTLFFEGSESRETLVAIPLGAIWPGNNPRKTFDEQQLADLAESIHAHGQQVPALVRKRPTGAGYELVAGERRWRACELAGVPTLLCRIVDLDDRAALEVALVENSARADVHPLEEADALAQLLEMGSDVEDLRGRLNRGDQWVRDRLALRQLHVTLRERFKAGSMPLRAAVVLAHLPEARQEEISNRRGTATITYRDALSLARSESPALADMLFDLGDATLGGHGACVTCAYRTDKQPDLLNPDNAAARCTDGDCATEKTERWVEIEEAGGTKVFRGDDSRRLSSLNSPSWQLREALRLGHDNQPPLYEMLPEVQRSIHVTSWGQTRLVAADADIAAALRARGQEAAALRFDPPQSAAAAPPERKPRAKAPAVVEALGQLFAAVEADPGVVDIRQIVTMLAASVGHNEAQAMLKRRGIKAGDQYPSRLVVKIAADAETVEQQTALALELLLAGQMGLLLSDRRVRPDLPLVEWMRRMGVAIPEHMVAES